MMRHSNHETARAPLCDEEIVALYFDRDEKAIEETDFKYRNYLFSAVLPMLGDRTDVEECLNDTYLGAWNAIPPTRPTVLKAFLLTVARRIAIKRYRTTLRKRTVPTEMTVSLSELEDFVTEGGDPDAAFDAERLGRVISDFVHSLPERKRFIFMSRYYLSQPIDTVARDLSLSRSMVCKELAAIRKALKETLESEGYSI